MNTSNLSKYLVNSPFSKYLDIFPNGEQLPSFIATVKGLKSATDLWVENRKWDLFCELAQYFGLLYHVDAYFAQDMETIKKLPQHLFTTTKAVFNKEFSHQDHAHVFISKSEDNLRNAIALGWYPLVVNNRVIQKHLADHYNFGKALGYPQCCRDFFQKRNHWYFYNNHYETYRNTSDKPTYLSNGLLRLTPFFLIPHIPCSFNCQASIEYAKTNRILINEESQEYLDEIERRLQTPVLCLSELKIYRFEGKIISDNVIKYQSVEAIYPTSNNDLLYQMLIKGDTCIIEGNIIRVYQKNCQINAYFARGDKHEVEIPFLINFH
ncbi:DUF483 domain-containing protein [Microcystis aeruginosa]|uniref:Uncharacterized protein n=1 Tax=Microcystis aeruginosa NIES-3807 TaxID=2517785 RepID=A0AAD3B269_MICAE|nr:DUF483 domain-containing protein [Microcystis aeruginosa]GCL59833.1 hypothetical protein NIES3807_30100 [Microcystis aeruginosa NIES-3807]